MNYFKVLFLLSYALSFGQVGIVTDKPDPNTALDVNGKVKVRDLPQTKSNGEQIIVTDSDGNLKTSDLATELLSAMKTFGGDSSILQVEFKSDLTKAGGKLHTDGTANQMKFNKIKSNKDNNYDVSNGIFTAPSNGLYFIKLFIDYKYHAKAESHSEFPIWLKIVYTNTAKNENPIGYKKKRNNVSKGYNDGRIISLISFVPLKKDDTLKVEFYIDTSGVSEIDGFTVKQEKSYFQIYKLL